MSSFVLKLIAIITMTIDHSGAILFEDVNILRIIGRLSFPIFAFLIANGYSYTKDIKKYMMRLFILSIISQYPFMIAFDLFDTVSLNIFFTLFLGLLAISSYEREKNKVVALFYVFLISYLATIMRSDYGYYGVLLIFCFHIFKDEFWKLALSIIVLNLGFSTSYVILYQYFDLSMYIQSFSCFSLIFIYFYNNKKGKTLKYLFYSYYPLHLLVLYLINKLGS